MANSAHDIFLAVSLDVEEEGLFGGSYQCRDVSVTNVRELTRLHDLCEAGIRPTLFCAHGVFADSAACHTLAHMRDRYGAEIGAHLHHWNTPPLVSGAAAAHAAHAVTSVPSAAVPQDIMAAKLQQLFAAAREFQGADVTSFRMGRWDLHREHWPLLADVGVTVDASVRPLHGRTVGGNPDHFDAPSNPYWITVGEKRIFEAPLTVTPLTPCLARLVSGPARTLQAGFHTWGALALLPVYHPLWAMKAITSLYIARGGRLLSLTWHSSEMMPGGAPHIPDANAVEQLLHKIGLYVAWLRGRWNIRCCTMRELPDAMGAAMASEAQRATPGCDWTFA